MGPRRVCKAQDGCSPRLAQRNVLGFLFLHEKHAIVKGEGLVWMFGMHTSVSARRGCHSSFREWSKQLHASKLEERYEIFSQPLFVMCGCRQSQTKREAGKALSVQSLKIK